MEGNQELISIIIPAYNTELYIEKCLKSIINQTYKDLEIIIVEDGSTDNTAELCDKWASYDKRIKVVHQNNGGVSKARNVGLNLVSGEYVMFVDSDDWIEKDYCESLVNLIKRYNADIVVSNLKQFGNVEHYSYDLIPYEKLINKNNALEFALKGKYFFGAAGGKILKKQIIKNVCFSDLSSSEDQLFIFETILNSDRIVLSNYGGYLYLQREESAVHSENQSKKYTNRIHCLYNFMNKLSVNPELKKYCILTNNELLREFYFYWYYFANVDSNQELLDWEKNVSILNTCHIFSSKIKLFPKFFLVIIKFMKKYSIKLKVLAWKLRRGKDCGL